MHGLSIALALLCEKLCSIYCNASCNEDMPIFTVHRPAVKVSKTTLLCGRGFCQTFLCWFTVLLLTSSACILPSSGNLFTCMAWSWLLVVYLYYLFINNGIFRKSVSLRVTVGPIYGTTECQGTVIISLEYFYCLKYIIAVCAKNYLGLILTSVYIQVWGHVVAQLVEALCYKLEGRRFDSWWCHLNF